MNSIPLRHFQGVAKKLIVVSSAPLGATPAREADLGL